MNKTREILARNLEFFRKRAGLTQASTAALCKVSLRSVQRAEDPAYENIDLSVILSISQALEVHPSKLMLGSGEGVPVSPQEALEVLAKALTERRETPTHSNPRIARLLSAIYEDEALLDVFEAALDDSPADEKKSRPSR